MPGQQSLTAADLNKFESEVAQAQNAQGASLAQAQYASALTNGVAAGDTSTPYAPATTFANTPAYQLNPTTSPAAFGITDPSATVFTGYADGTVMGTNQIIGALADKFGIVTRGKSERSLEEQVLAHMQRALALPAYPNGEPMQQAEPGANSAPAAKNRRRGMEAMAPSAAGLRSLPAKEINALAKGANTSAQPSLDAIAERLGVDPAAAPGGNLWAGVAQHFGVTPLKAGTKQVQTVAQVFDGLASWSTPQIQYLQGLMYDAGLMPASVTPDAKKAAITGNWDIPTQQALGQLLQITSEANKAGQDVKWTDVLNAMVKNRDKGMIAMYPQTHPAITVATQEQMTQPAISAFENRLGRTPTASELSGLTSSFDAQQLAHAANVTPGSVLFPDNSNVQQVPGAPSALQAAENYAMGADPIGYQGHQFANAYALFLNALVPGKLPGVDPNITSAARPL
jgi:hypothetical protein